MGRFTQFILARNYPPRLVYHGGAAVILEVVKGEDRIFKWLFRARRDIPGGKSITLAATYGSRSSLFETMHEYGFIPDDGPAMRIMLQLVELGFARSSMVKRKA